MRLIQPRATKLSDITIDQDLDLGSAGYNLLLGGYALKFTDTLIKQKNASTVHVRNVADTATQQFEATYLRFLTGLKGAASPIYLDAGDVDGQYLVGRARESSIVLAEIFRMVGATTAYFKLIGGRCKLDDVDIRQAMFVWGQIAG